MPFLLMNSIRVGSIRSFISICVYSVEFSWALMSLFCARMATVIIRISLLRSNASVTSFGSHHSALPACLTPARCTIPKPYSITRRLYLASLRVVLASLRIYFSAWWSPRTVKLLPRRFGCKSKITQMIARYSRWSASKLIFWSLKIFAQYPIGWPAISSCSLNNTLLFRRSRAFASSVYHPFSR